MEITELIKTLTDGKYFNPNKQAKAITLITSWAACERDEYHAIIETYIGWCEGTLTKPDIAAAMQAVIDKMKMPEYARRRAELQAEIAALQHELDQLLS